MAVHLFNVAQYTSLEAEHALADITAHPQIFLGDTHHYSKPTQAALIDVFSQVAARGEHRDLCIEYSARELQAEQAYSKILWSVFRKTGLAEFDFSSFCDLDLQDLSSIHPNKDPQTMLTSLSAMYRFVAARKNSVQIHPVDFDDKLIDKNLYRRLGRDNEVAANIDRAVEDRPFVCIYGSSHLRPNGLLKHFAKQSTVSVFAYGTPEEFYASLVEQTTALWLGRLRLSPPQYIYVGEAQAFFRHKNHEPLVQGLS